MRPSTTPPRNTGTSELHRWPSPIPLQRPVTPPLAPAHPGSTSLGSFIGMGSYRATSCASMTNLLDSLLFDLEINDDVSAESPFPTQRLPSELQRLVSSNGRAQAMLWMHALQAKEALSLDDSADTHVDVHAFAQALADMGHLVWLRNGTYTCPADSGLSRIKHTFVVASLSSDQSSQPLYCVVDPNWQDHFQLSGEGAAEYRQMLALLPGVFVGCAEQLGGIVSLLCKEMEKVFQSRGVPLPPWRSPQVMQGRWLVDHAEDEHVPASNITFNRTQSTDLTPALAV